MLRKVRLTLQIVFFTAFVVLFFFFEVFRMEPKSSGLALFLRLNPFVTMITSIAARSVVVSCLVFGIIVTIITMLFGRVFCGMFCPLGSIIDFSDSIFRKKEKKKQPRRPSQKLQGLKYIFLFALAVLALLGLTFPLFMDPLLLVTRVFTLLVRPALYTLNQFIPFLKDAEFTASPFLQQGAYAGAFMTFILLLIILLGAIFDRRFWCQYICPSGAFFGLISRFSLFTRRVDTGKCNSCGICSAPRCPTRSISGENCEKTTTAECITCGKCTDDKRLCTAFGFHTPKLSTSGGPDIGRRHLVSGIVNGFIFAPVLVRKYKRKKPFVPGPIRPPGAVEENAFLARCIACEACVSVCPQNALHPCTISKDGVINWNTPKLVPRIGFCEEDCTRCSEACPTGALLPITAEEKLEQSIGTAIVERGRCRSWRMQYKCIICARKCPYDAIEKHSIFNEKGREFIVPIVNKRKCIGCGVCEYRCPVKSESAIQVFAYGEKRTKVGKKKKSGNKKS